MKWDPFWMSTFGLITIHYEHSYVCRHWEYQWCCWLIQWHPAVFWGFLFHIKLMPNATWLYHNSFFSRFLRGWGLGGFSKVIGTFSHVSRSFNLYIHNWVVWTFPSFQMWGYVLHVEHISCVITNWGYHQWAIPSLFSIALWALMELKFHQKITIPIFTLVLQNFVIPG